MRQPFREAGAPTATGRGSAILLVEDDEPLARALVRMIAGEGYEVVHASTGNAAIQNMRTRSFDAVVTDLHLGGTSGVDVLKSARAHDADVPLVLMSGSPTLATALEAVRLGVLEYLVKPMSRDQLTRVLGRARSGRLAAWDRRALAHRLALAEARVGALLSEELRPRFDGDPWTRPSSIVPLCPEFASADADE